MIFTGNNSRKIGEGKNFSFAVNFHVDDTRGYAEFGLSGSSTQESIKFSLESGRMIDPNGKHFGSYLPNDKTLLSGNVNTGSYEYYVKNKLNYSLGSKSDFTVDSFFANTRDCSLSADVFIYGDKHNVSATLPSSCLESGTITGTITNNSYSNLSGFWIFSGEVVQANDVEYFEFDTSVYSLPRRVGSSDNFVLKNLFFNEEILDVNLKFYTSFGEHEEAFLVSGVL